MTTLITDDPKELGQVAAELAAQKIIRAIKENEEANIVVATGASQFETLKHLIQYESIDWKKVRMFHLDEYIGLPSDHPASFRKYLFERFVSKLPAALKEIHFINGNAHDPGEECRRMSVVIKECPVHLALVGIGENAHLAFNDPPADFETTEPFIIVELDEACRSQQMHEGWFGTFEEVPVQAISMSIHQIMLAHSIVCSVPEKRKAEAVKACTRGKITPNKPASILQDHLDCTLILDKDSASLM